MTDQELLWNYDRDLMKELNHFLKKINDRALYQRGLLPSYEGLDLQGNEIPALAEDVEYFHPTITLDDRMHHIAVNIVQADIPLEDIICNTIISHFYGARGIHQVLTGNNDPTQSLVEFTRIAAGDDAYTKELQDRAMAAKLAGTPLWGTTELRTSLWGAAKDFARKKYNDPKRILMPLDVAEWVASFITDGTIERMKQVNSLEEMYNVLVSHRGIGEYYGYHCSTSNSVNPQLNYSHDDEFIMPGPGARKTVDLMWHNTLPKKLYGKAVAFIRQNQEEIGIIDGVNFHPSTWNFTLRDGSRLFEDDQNELKHYGTEVLCCQFGVYLHLKANPNLAKKRKVSRATQETTAADSVFG